MLERITAALLDARTALWREFERLHREVLKIVRDDKTCRHLVSVPGVGPRVAIGLKSAIDDPTRIKKSKAVALVGLTRKKVSVGWTGGISRVGDEMVRTVLYQAANVMPTR